MSDYELILDTINNSLRRIETTLYTGGGYMERLTRVEGSLEDLIKVNQMQAESICKLTANVAELKEIVKNHHNDKALHNFWGLSTNKKTLCGIALVFIFFHSLITIIPDISVVTKFLLKLVGL
jgi:hypothetical protein